MRQWSGSSSSPGPKGGGAMEMLKELTKFVKALTALINAFKKTK
jgi:hypothetical protein